MNGEGDEVGGEQETSVARSSAGSWSTSRTPAVSIAGVRIDALDRRQAASRILQAAATSTVTTVHLCNAYVVALASRDHHYAELLGRGNLNLADGAPVARFARKAGLDPSLRPSGVELVEEVLGQGVGMGVRHYFHGSDKPTVTALVTALRDRFPGVEIVAAESPPFGEVTDQQLDDLAERLQATQADVVWIGLGTPKQDGVVDRLRSRFDGPAIPVGAAFDFIAGSKPRAPRLLRRLGLEWVHRLTTEPRRLWRRYLWGNVRFLWVRARTGRVLRRDDRPDA